MVDPKVWEAIDNCRDPWGGTTKIDVGDVPEPLRTELWSKVKDFDGQPMSNYLRTQIEKAMKAVDPAFQRWIRRDPADPAQFLVSFTVGSPFPIPQPKQPSRAWPQFPEGESPRLFAPNWDRFAKTKAAPAAVAGCSGTVVLNVLIAPDGHVAEAQVAEGPEALREPALEAARQWTFRTVSTAGHALEVQTELRLEFPALADAVQVIDHF